MASSKKNTRSNKNKQIKNKKNIKKNDNQFLIVNICNIIILIIVIIVLVINILIYIKTNESEKNPQKEVVNLEDINPHYVFLGDSITAQYELSEYFEGYSVVNSGIDGDTTEALLTDLDSRLYQYNPSTVFIMIGTNDVNSNKSVDHTFGNIKKIVQEIQINLPYTKIIVQSITPSQENWGENDNNKIRKEINKLLYEEYKNSSSVEYLDLYSILEESDSGILKDNYTQDGLHLNNEAYSTIAIEQKKYMKKD